MSEAVLCNGLHRRSAHLERSGLQRHLCRSRSETIVISHGLETYGCCWYYTSFYDLLTENLRRTFTNAGGAHPGSSGCQYNLPNSNISFQMCGVCRTEPGCARMRFLCLCRIECVRNPCNEEEKEMAISSCIRNRDLIAASTSTCVVAIVGKTPKRQPAEILAPRLLLARLLLLRKCRQRPRG